jgi:hypothetical protein
MSEYTDADRRFTVQDEVCKNALVKVAKIYRLADDMAFTATKDFCDHMSAHLNSDVGPIMPRDAVDSDLEPWGKVFIAWSDAYLEGPENNTFPARVIKQNMDFYALRRFVREMDIIYSRRPKINRSEMLKMMFSYLTALEDFVNCGRFMDGTQYDISDAMEYEEWKRFLDMIGELRRFLEPWLE